MMAIELAETEKRGLVLLGKLSKKMEQKTEETIKRNNW